jgi:hypothetical protein
MKKILFHSLLYSLFVILLIGCVGTGAQVSLPRTPTSSISTDCPLTKPVWAKPPADSAVQSEPEFGSYFINEDRSLWASAGWIGKADTPLRVSADGVKVGWFRPEGADLVITGQRIDAETPPLKADIPCCYPTRFQATGLYFSAPGCWKITAKAAEKELSFVVAVEP